MKLLDEHVLKFLHFYEFVKVQLLVFGMDLKVDTVAKKDTIYTYQQNVLCQNLIRPSNHRAKQVYRYNELFFSLVFHMILVHNIHFQYLFLHKFHFHHSKLEHVFVVHNPHILQSMYPKHLKRILFFIGFRI